jgi:polyhydroxyalkanoate synthase subunit PhaC
MPKLPNDVKSNPPTSADAMATGREWAQLAGKINDLAAKLAGSPPSAAMLPIQMAQDITASFGRFYAALLREPNTLAEAQLDFWRKQVELWENLARPQEGKPRVRDRRFRNPEWESNPALRGLLQSYLVGADWLRSLADKGDIDQADRKKVIFFTDQFIDTIAPTNFALVNPDVVTKTMETGGQNFVQGFSNFLDDALAGSGHVRRADQEAFKLGVSIAATKGSVVLRTEMMELIQYEPTTEKVREVPLLLISPWVNKYYLFDLQPKASFIKWAVSEGYTVFAVSWVNPDTSHADKDFENYWLEGPEAAFEAIAKATGQDKVNIVGYCLGGTLTASGLAYMTAKGDERANTATMIATMTDFADPGDFQVFVSNESIRALRAQLDGKGYLTDAELSTLFSLLRANDLIWSSAISSYLLAEKAVPSDLLFWFSDGIGMPGKMLDTFMGAIMLDNALAKPGRLKLAGTPLDLTAIRTPLCFVSLKDDHVAKWETTYRGALRFKAEKRFILGGSGHNAGTINPPAAQKHGYWTNEAFPADPQAWLKGAQRHEGSWWADWSNWLKERSGPEVPARIVTGGPLQILEAAPGSYARVRR